MRRAPKAELVRFVAVCDEGAMRLRRDVSGRMTGRGAYVCPGEECFSRAVARRAFGRALRVRGEELKVETERVAHPAA